jgi:hypothetical protein
VAAKKLVRKRVPGREIEIVRPERAELSAEEVAKRMDEFAEQRKEKLIATVRKGKG